MLIFRRLQGDSIGRHKKGNCTLKENRDYIQANKYKLMTILTIVTNRNTSKYK